MASTIAGSGAASGGKYRGVAPDATLLDGKVCEDNGCADSAILAGMQWAAVEKQAAVVNLSLGGSDTPEVDPLEEAVQTLTAQTGTLFVIAAGNDGTDGSVGSPGTADAALAVGAVDRDDELADFSSRGPRVGDDALKPDITAPGVDIVAARSADGDIGDPVGEQYVTLSGTSMATPHVAGSAALLAQQHPGWRAGQLKATLMAAAKPHPDQTAYQQGAGRVDVARAITQQVTSDPVSVSFGRALWPHGDDTPITRTVTWRNGGPAPVTLDLTVEGAARAGPRRPACSPRRQPDHRPGGRHGRTTVTADTRLGASTATGPGGSWPAPARPWRSPRWRCTGRWRATRSPSGTWTAPARAPPTTGPPGRPGHLRLLGRLRLRRRGHRAGPQGAVRAERPLLEPGPDEEPRRDALLAQPELVVDRDTRSSSTPVRPSRCG